MYRNDHPVLRWITALDNYRGGNSLPIHVEQDICVTELISPKGILCNQQGAFLLESNCGWLHEAATCEPACVIPQS